MVHERDNRIGATRLNDAEMVLPPYDSPIVAVWLDVREPVFAVKLPDLELAAITIVEGTLS